MASLTGCGAVGEISGNNTENTESAESTEENTSASEEATADETAGSSEKKTEKKTEAKTEAKTDAEEKTTGAEAVSEGTAADISEPDIMSVFYSGVWESTAGTEYIFYADLSGGRRMNAGGETGVPFEYEYSGNGTYIFHFGARDYNTPVSAEFVSDDTVNFTWDDGTTETLTHITFDVPSDNDESTEVTYFSSGVWDSTSGYKYIFYTDLSGGKRMNPGEETGVPFEYEYSGNGTYTFHFGARDFNKSVSADFVYDDTVNLTWDDGISETLTHTSSDAE